MATRVSGYELVGELPGKGPWKVCQYGPLLVFVAPDAPPYCMQGGKLMPLDIGSAHAEIVSVIGPVRTGEAVPP